MKKKTVNKKVALLAVGVLMTSSLLTGCKSFNKPEYIEVSPSQTAFLIPMLGSSANQKKLPSEQALKDNLVMDKRVMIPHVWQKQGRSILFLFENGKWVNSSRLIVVERRPITREWTESNASGTTNKNEGISAETKESIGFMVRMNASAQIDEADTPTFLYRYSGRTLEQIMDTEIRARIESKFVETSAKYSLEDLLVGKEAILKIVRYDVQTYFKARGINVTTVGLKGELTYLNPEIQKTIDAKFQSAKTLESQRNENEKKIEKATADAKAIQIQADNIVNIIKLQQLDNQKSMIEKWDGKYPTVMSGNGNGIMLQMQNPTTK